MSKTFLPNLSLKGNPPLAKSISVKKIVQIGGSPVCGLTCPFNHLRWQIIMLTHSNLSYLVAESGRRILSFSEPVPDHPATYLRLHPFLKYILLDNEIRSCDIKEWICLVNISGKYEILGCGAQVVGRVRCNIIIIMSIKKYEMLGCEAPCGVGICLCNIPCFFWNFHPVQRLGCLSFLSIFSVVLHCFAQIYFFALSRLLEFADCLDKLCAMSVWQCN